MTLYDELRQVKVNDQGTNWNECCAEVDRICEEHAARARRKRRERERQELYRRIADLESEVNRQEQAMGLVVAMAQYERRHDQNAN